MNINTLEKRKKDVLNKIKTEQVLQQMMKQIKQTQQHMLKRKKNRGLKEAPKGKFNREYKLWLKN